MSDESRELLLHHVQKFGFGERGVRAINETGNSEAMFSLLGALDAARAQVEAMTRDRDGWERRTKAVGSVVIRAWALLRDWWQYAQLEEREEPFVDALARALAADREHDAYALAEMRRLRDENGALAAELAAVRKVEEWLREFGAEYGRTIQYHGEFEALDFDGEEIEGAQSLVALGRALAAQEGGV